MSEITGQVMTSQEADAIIMQLIGAPATRVVERLLVVRQNAEQAK